MAKTIKIGLDAGHGLNTAGKRTPSDKEHKMYHEWELNDAVRDRVVKILKDYDCEIVHCDGDEGNTDESLSDRRKKYVDAKCDAMVSIHHNATSGKWNKATGVEVFYDKTPIKGDKELAEAIYKNFPKYTGLKGRGIKQEDWAVINQNKIPAVLCEGGFMDSTIDYPVITSSKGQDAYARAVAEGLVSFLGLKKKAVKTAETTSKEKAVNYTIKVNGVARDDVLYIREKPNADAKRTGYLKYNDPNKYTIVAEQNGWGKLKSGVGWINLKYTKKC